METYTITFKLFDGSLLIKKVKANGSFCAAAYAKAYRKKNPYKIAKTISIK